MQQKVKHSARDYLVLAGAFLILFCSLGLSANGMALFNVPVTKDLGFSQTAFAMYFIAAMIPSLALSAFVGIFWSKHFKLLRIVLLINGFIACACVALCGACTKLWQFYVLSIIRGAVGAFITILPASMLANNWFPDKRATATSIVMIGSSVGGIFFTQACKVALNMFNWRVAYVTVGVLCAALYVVAAILVKPFPNREVTVTDSEKKEPEKIEQPGILMRDAMKKAPFWIMIIGFTLGGFASMGFQGNIATALQLDYGYTTTQAAACYSLFTAVAIFGKLFIGWFYDKFGVKAGLTYLTIMLVASLVSMLLAQKLVFGYMLAIFFGLGNMIGTITSTTIPPDIFGLRDYSKIYGFLTMFISGSMSVGTILSTGIYDLTGSFRPAWILYIVFNVACTFCLLLSRRMVKGKDA